MVMGSIPICVALDHLLVGAMCEKLNWEVGTDFLSKQFTASIASSRTWRNALGLRFDGIPQLG